MRRPPALLFWARRSARRGALLTLIALSCAVVAGLAVVAVALAVRAPGTELQRALHDTPARLASVTISAAGDPASQDRRFRTLVAKEFRSAPVDITETVDGSRTTWTVAPDPDRMTTAQLADLEHGFRDLADGARGVFAEDGGIRTQHSGLATAITLRGAVDAVRGLAPVPITLLAVAGTVALGMLFRLLVAARNDDDRLLRARGASAGLLLRAAAVESLVLGVLGTAIGGISGAIVAARLWGPPTSPAETVGPLLATLAITVGAGVAAALAGVSTRFELPVGRAGAAVSGAVAVLLLAIAALAVWRYLDPVAAAQRSADPLAVIAPAAALTALGITAALLVGPVLALAVRSAVRRPGPVAPLATRLAARDLRVLGAPATLLTFAVAAGVLAATTIGSTAAFLGDSSRLVHGGALRATVGGSIPLSDTGDLLPAGVRDTAARKAGISPVLRFSGATPNGPVDVIGVDADALPGLTAVDRRMFDAEGIRGALRGATAGLALPGSGTRPLALDLALKAGDASVPELDFYGQPTGIVDPVDQGTAAVSAIAWLADPQGDLAPVATDSAPMGSDAESTPTISAPIPTGGPWRLIAVDLAASSDVDLADASIRVTGIRAGSAEVRMPATTWTVATGAYDDAALRTGRATGTLGVSTAALRSSTALGVAVRLVPAGGGTVPVAVSRSLADAQALHVGSVVAVDSTWAGLRGRVAAIVPVVPGTDGGPALLADLATLDRGMLAASQQPSRIRELWAAGDGVRDRIVAALPSATVTTPTSTTEARFTALTSAELLLGVVAATLFAVLALSAAAVSLARDRDDEARGLRAVGVTPAEQGLARAFGPAAVTVHAAVAGVIAGGITALLVAGTTARAAAPTAPAALPVVDAVTWPVVLGSAGVALAAGAIVATVHGLRIRTAARTAGAGTDA